MKQILLILGLLSVLLCSCTTNERKQVKQQNEVGMEKKNLGSLLALYPKPMTVIGAEVEGKVNWLVSLS